MRVACLLALLLARLLARRPFFLPIDRASAPVDLNLPQPSLEDPVTVQADQATHWTQGAYEVWHLEGSCMITQGLVYARAAEGVIWVERAGPNGVPPNKVIAYLEGKVTIDYQAGTDGIVEKDKALLAKSPRRPGSESFRPRRRSRSNQRPDPSRPRSRRSLSAGWKLASRNSAIRSRRPNSPSRTRALTRRPVRRVPLLPCKRSP